PAPVPFAPKPATVLAKGESPAAEASPAPRSAVGEPKSPPPVDKGDASSIRTDFLSSDEPVAQPSKTGARPEQRQSTRERLQALGYASGGTLQRIPTADASPPATSNALDDRAAATEPTAAPEPTRPAPLAPPPQAEGKEKAATEKPSPAPSLD